MEQEKLKILLIAPNCDGTDVGEAWSTYQWASRLSRRHEVTVLTYHKLNRPSAIEQLPQAEVVEWVDLPIMGRWERFNSLAKPGYIRFYFKARRWIERELRTGRCFDIVHQVAPLSLRYPSPGSGFGIPFLIGPLAGSLSTPPAFAAELRGTAWYMNLRALDHLRIRFDPLLRRTYGRADVLIGVAPYVAELLQSVNVKRFEIMSETGVTSLPELVHVSSDKNRCRLLYVGRIVRMKGVRDAIRAMGQLPSSCNATLDIVGDGEDRAKCEEEARQLGLMEVVRFHGRIPRQEVDSFYRKADVFLFPSIREPSGNVILEAMSFGLPLIVADRGGPGYVVTEDNGVRIPVTTPEEFATKLSDAIAALASAPERRREMGAHSRNIIETHHTWGKKIDCLESIYLRLLTRL